MDIRKINEKLPDNVACIVLDFDLFFTYLDKLSDLWYSIFVEKPENKEEKVNYVIAYMSYEVEQETKYVFWVFNNGESKLDLVKEINEIIAEIEDKDE